MAFIREDVNEYGTPVSVMECETCGMEFTVCPSVSDPSKWPDCTAPECASYDESRDIDIMFGDRSGLEKNREKFNRPVSMEAFKDRKTMKIWRSEL